MRILLMVGAMAVAFGGTAAAASFTYANEGIANPGQSINFDGLADGTVIGSTYAGQGVAFTGLQATSAFGDRFVPTTQPAAINRDANSGLVTPQFELTFSTAVSAFSFYFVSNGRGTSVTSFLGDVVRESFNIGPYAGESDFFGFTNTRIDRVVFAIGGDGLGLLDDVAFTLADAATPVPEPASLALLGAGLIGAGLIRRRNAG